MTNSLQNRVILVTGVTQGLGEQVALYCAEQGATVILVGRKQRKLEALYDQITQAGWPEPVAIQMDFLTISDDELSAYAYQIKQTTGKLDGIIHCAAYFYALSPLFEQRMDEWQNQYRINTVAPFALTRACLPLLADSPNAHVIFVGESHAHQPKAYWGGFGASKAGLAYLAQVAQDEWDKTPKIHVHHLIPGCINSPQRNRTHPGEAKTERANIADILPFFKAALLQEGDIRTDITIDCAALLATQKQSTP